MGSENVGVLLHKLTKYQTLLANSHENSKMSTYRQKINQYTSKLENLGVDRSTLTQIGGLVDNYDDVLKGLIDIQTKKIEKKFENLRSKNPDTGKFGNLEEKVKEVNSRFTTAQTKYDGSIKILMDLIIPVNCSICNQTLVVACP